MLLNCLTSLQCLCKVRIRQDWCLDDSYMLAMNSWSFGVCFAFEKIEHEAIEHAYEEDCWPNDRTSCVTARKIKQLIFMIFGKIPAKAKTECYSRDWFGAAIKFANFFWSMWRSSYAKGLVLYLVQSQPRKSEERGPNSWYFQRTFWKVTPKKLTLFIALFFGQRSRKGIR